MGAAELVTPQVLKTPTLGFRRSPRARCLPRQLLGPTEADAVTSSELRLRQHSKKTNMGVKVCPRTQETGVPACLEDQEEQG